MLKIHDKELYQQPCQEADGIAQDTIDEGTRQDAEKEVIPQCFDDNYQQLAQNNRHKAAVDVDDEKVQGDVGENVDDDRRAQHQPTPFSQEQQHHEFYQNRWNEGKQQRR